MLIQASSASAGPSSHDPSLSGSSSSPASPLTKRQPVILAASAVIFVGLTMLILITTVPPRMNAVPGVTDPPQSLLPGNKLPKDAVCERRHDLLFACEIQTEGTVIYLDYDGMTQRILYTTLRVQDQTIANLILLWGTPQMIRFSAESSWMKVFWGTRAAYVSACPLQPDSRVSFIGYGPAQSTEFPPSPWHGFANKDYVCQRS
jgi:hypothetical protein